MCLFGGGKSAPAPATAPPPPDPEKPLSQVAPVTNDQAKRKANPNAPQGVSAFRESLMLSGATTGLNNPR